MKKIILALICAGSLTFTSCQEWLDVNQDPNAVSTVENGLIIPAVELNMITDYGMFANMIGTYFCDQWAVKVGGPNCFYLLQWNVQDGNMPASMADRYYRQSYVRVINNLKVVRENAKAEGNAGDYLAATVLRDFTYQTLVDMFGEVPYLEAEDPETTSPHYDEGSKIYEELITDLKDAKAYVEETGAKTACDNMLFMSDTDVNNWIQFANALLLRLYMRESGVVDVKADVKALIDEDNFPEKDICFGSSLFTAEAGKENPTYNNFIRSVGNMDIVGHMCTIGTMSSYNDPRLTAKFKPSQAYGTYEGDFISSQQSVEKTEGYANEKTFSEPVLTSTTPVYLITKADTDFLLAEYYLGTDDGKAEEYYESAIKASCDQCGVSGAETIYESEQFEWKGTDEQKKEIIGIQKWLANTGVNGFEAWCETRRMGYPQLNSVDGVTFHDKFCKMAAANIEASKDNPTPTCNDMVVAGLYEYGKILTPTISSGFTTDAPYIQRMLYPSSSKKTNANAPEQKSKTDKIFWAK